MTVTVNPNGKSNTHHTKLSYNSQDVGLIRVSRRKDKKGEYKWTEDDRGYTYNALPSTAIKTYTGDQGYNDTPPPWTPMVQSDWSGGRGNKNFDNEKTKFSDSYRMNTTRDGEIILGPWDNWATGISDWVGYWEGIKANVSSRAGLPINLPILRVADSFVATGTPASVWIIVSCVGAPTDLTICFREDSTGSPGAIMDSGGGFVPSTTLAYTSLKNGGAWEVVRVSISAGFTPGETYWLSLEAAGATGNYWLIGTAGDSNQASKVYIGSWSNFAQTAVYHRVCLAEDPFKAHFYEYKGGLYAALQYESGADSTLYVNGDQGLFKTGATTSQMTIEDGLASWSADELKGTIAQITKGTAMSQSKNWRRISTNLATSGGETVLTVADDWAIAPAEHDEFTLIGSKKWTLLDTTTTQPTGGDWDGLTTASVTDVLSVNHAVYFGMGDDVKVQRMRIYNSSGEWKPNWTEEDDAQFSYLGQSTDENGNWIWGAKGGYPAVISKAAAVDCSGTNPSAADLDFVGAGGSTSPTTINTGDVGERIRSLANYGQYGNLYVLKEASVYSVYDDIPYKLGLTQMGNQLDYRNGTCSLVHNTYLYFPYKGTLMRYNYVTEVMDNVGPTADEEGLPSDRLCTIVALDSYENLVLAAFDGGAGTYSCIMAWNGYGWHELYRPPAVGLRIQSLYVQSIPADNVDRLWFSCGSDIGWLTMSSDPYNTPILNNYHHYSFAMDGHLITSYIYFNQQDVLKAFNSIRGIIERGAATNYTVTVDYRLDDTAAWTRVGTLDGFRDILPISSTYNATGRRIQFRISPYSYKAEYTPRITNLIYESLVQQKYRKYIDMLVMISDGQRDLMGNPDDIPLYTTKIGYLNTWAQNPYGVLMRDVSSELDNKYVKLDTPSTRLVDSFVQEGRHYWIVQLRLYECATT